MPLILGANSVSGGYEIDNSLRFNSGSSDYLSRTPAGGGNRDTFTVSFWVKRANLTSSQRIFTAGTSIGTNNDNLSSILFESNDKFIFFGEIGGVGSFNLTTTQLFRDVSAWYHIVVAVDTTQATSSNRIKIYSNGSQITSFSTSTYMTQNTDTFFNAANLHVISGVTSGGFLNGYLSEFYLIDGQQLTPSSFGETDQDTNIWKPKAYTGTYGTNGFYLEFQNSGALGTDSSGNGNTFTVNNLTSIDQTTDTPTNNFATMNALMIPTSNAGTFTEGNLSVQSASSGYFGGGSTLGASKGKWYWEGKITAQTAQCGHLGIDGNPSESARLNYYAGQASWSYGYNGASGNKFNNNSDSAYGGTFTLNDILMIAMDLGNNYVYFGINGTWQNSGVPTSGASGTGSAFSISTSPPSGNYFIVTGDGSGSNNATFASNFGNPSFTISSGNADANGYGNFEYAVPSGYYALNTKNLAQFG